MKKLKTSKNSSLSAVPVGYAELLSSLKARIRKVQIKVALSANRALVDLYWDIGKSICVKQKNEAWGAKVIERLLVIFQKNFQVWKGCLGPICIG